MPPDEVSIPEDTEITCAETSIPIDEFARLEDRGIFQDISYNDEEDSIVGSVEINARTLAEFIYQYDTLEKVASHTRVRILRYIRDSEFKRHGTQGIAEELDIHPTTASRHLNGLHRDGYLEKERDGEFIRDVD